MKWSQAADRQVVDAVVRTFRADECCLHGAYLSLAPAQWERSYYWLDASGMALYLLRRLEELDFVEALPRSVQMRLRRNLADNQQRSDGMFEEFLELNQAFQSAGVDYCNLKGFTLSPHSCPDPELRYQLDFDFLVDGADLLKLKEILSARGYVLRAVTNTAWEFKTNSDELATIANLYKTREQRCIELHFACESEAPHRASRDARLDRLEWTDGAGLPLPKLSPVDLFIGQATHIFSHLCGPATRLAWLLEFMNHITFRSDDACFWEEMVERTAANEDTLVAVGVAFLTVKEIFGAAIPGPVDRGIIAPMPAAAALWTKHYGARAVLADFPGTKLSLLLREQLRQNADDWKQTKRRALVPSRRPPRIIHVSRTASAWKRLRGDLYQLRYELFRLRFHVVEGMIYLRELRRWRRLLSRDGLQDRTEAGLVSTAVQSR